MSHRAHTILLLSLLAAFVVGLVALVAFVPSDDKDCRERWVVMWFAPVKLGCNKRRRSSQRSMMKNKGNSYMAKREPSTYPAAKPISAKGSGLRTSVNRSHNKVVVRGR